MLAHATWLHAWPANEVEHAAKVCWLDNELFQVAGKGHVGQLHQQHPSSVNLLAKNGVLRTCAERP